MNEESKKESSGEVSSIGNKINKLDSSSGIQKVPIMTGQSLFSMGSSSGGAHDVLQNIHSSGGDGESSDKSPFALQKNLLSSGTSGINQDSQHLDNSLNNLFDSLRHPQHHTNFDLTQKLNDHFQELVSHCETIHELDSLATPMPSYNESIMNKQS